MSSRRTRARAGRVAPFPLSCRSAVQCRTEMCTSRINPSHSNAGRAAGCSRTAAESLRVNGGARAQEHRSACHPTPPPGHHAPKRTWPVWGPSLQPCRHVSQALAGGVVYLLTGGNCAP